MLRSDLRHLKSSAPYPPLKKATTSRNESPSPTTLFEKSKRNSNQQIGRGNCVEEQCLPDQPSGGISRPEYKKVVQSKVDEYSCLATEDRADQEVDPVESRQQEQYGLVEEYS